METIEKRFHSETISIFKRLSGPFATFVFAAGILVLLGWQFDVLVLKSILPNLTSMKPLTAVGFILIGSAIWFLQSEEAGKITQTIVLFFGLFPTLLGGMLLLEYLVPIDLGIDQVLFRNAVLADGDLYPGRPSPTTSLCIFLLGIVIMSLYYKRVYVASYVTPFVLVLNLLAIVGYVYDVSSLYTIGPYTPIALHTAILFLIATLGLLFTRPTQPPLDRLTTSFAGGVMARRLLPFAILLPFVFGWLRLQGQRAGWYGTEFGLALFATTNIIIFTYLIYLTSSTLNLTDEKRESAFKQLNESEKRYRNTLDTMLEGCQIIGFDWTYLYVNEAVARHGRQTRENLIGHTMMEVYPGIEQSALFKVLETCMRERVPAHLENEFTYPDGEKGWFDLGVQPVPAGIFILSIDITERKKAQLALQGAEQKYRTIVEQSPMIVYLDEVGGNWQYISPQIEPMLGYNVEEWLNNPSLFKEHIHKDDIHKLETALRESRANNSLYTCEYRFIKPNGEVLWLHDEAVFIEDEVNHRMLMQGVLYDISKQKFAEEALHDLNLTLEQRIVERTVELEKEITQRKKAEEALRQEAIRDPLTSLFNRRFMEESLAREVRRAKRKGTSLIVVMIDFDHFKKFNDTYGHDAGDEILRAFGSLLKTKIREADIACRYGGEEFTLILPDVSLNDAHRRMEELQGEIKIQTIRYKGIALSGFTLSMGISISPEHGETAEILLKKADNALYRAKDAGRDRIVIYS